MTAAAVSMSSLTTSLARYLRSQGLWLLLLIPLIGARLMIPLKDGAGVVIALDGQLPYMTSAFLGVSLGIVVTTLLLPIGWIYLRSNTTRRQPWQVEEVTGASRVAIAFGRFSADVVILLATLAALTLGGWFLGWLIIPPGALDLAHITLALWLVATPALIGLAALRILFDARPLLRSGFGDFMYFVIWTTSLVTPLAAVGRPASLLTNMFDFPGFTTPLLYGAPPEILESNAIPISIGGVIVREGRVELDVIAGLFSAGYVESRLVWIAIALVLVVLAGKIYHPHRARQTSKKPGRMTAFLGTGPPPRVIADAPPAPRVKSPSFNLIMAEFRLIGAGRMFLLLAMATAIAAYFVDFRSIANPAALLLLVFGLSTHAGRSETRGLRSLTDVAPLQPMLRRAAFVIAGAGWTILLALPALARTPTFEILAIAAGTGAVAALLATLLASVSGSSFAPRLVLFVLWYGYASFQGSQ